MLRFQKKPSRLRVIFRLILLLLILGGLIAGGIWLFSPKGTSSVVAYRLPCEDNNSLRAFGNYVLYYDGKSIHCLSSTGTVRWSFPIGPNAGFDCTDKILAAWSGSTIYILDQNGTSSYNDNLGESIQFARAGRQYVAAVVGETIRPRLIVKDLTGAHMDEESDAYDDLIILDVDFYGKNGEYMWSLALDVFGLAANTILNTFEVGKMNTGEVSLGESITYDIIYESGQLRVIGTRNMKTFNYRGTEDLAQSALVYGWQLMDHEITERGEALMLFAPTAQGAESQTDIRALRVIGPNLDRRYTMPETSIGGAIWQRTLYAFSSTMLYRAGMLDSRFMTTDLPLDRPITRLIDVTANGRAIVACGDEVYTLTLPTTN